MTELSELNLKPGDTFVMTDDSGDHASTMMVTDENGCAIPRPTKPVAVTGRMPHDTTEQRKHVFLSKASSRKELAETLHALVLPLLQQNANNLEVARRKITELETKVAALEQRLLSPEAE